MELNLIIDTRQNELDMLTTLMKQTKEKQILELYQAILLYLHRIF